MQFTRGQIIEYLSSHKRASAIELSRALNLTPANIRHHLTVLEKQKIVQVCGKQEGTGPGRPRDVYSLTPYVLKDNLEGLVRNMLRTFIENSPREGKSLELLAQTMSGDIADPHQKPIARFNRAVERLEELDYQARWEAHHDGPRFILHHCPYRELSCDSSTLCEMDRHLLQILLGREVIQISKMDIHNPSGTGCMFQVVD